MFKNEQLPNEICCIIHRFNSHPCADMIRALKISINYDDTHETDENYYWDPKYYITALAMERHLELCCEYEHHIRHDSNFKRSISYSAKKLNLEMRVDSDNDIDVDIVVNSDTDMDDDDDDDNDDDDT